jgi:PAS domain S-box-containing protein
MDLDSLSPDALREALRDARRQLADRQRHLDLIEQLAGIGSWEIDLERDAVVWSAEQCRIHGYTTDNAPTRHSVFMSDVLHPEDRAIVDTGMAALAGGEPVTVEFRARRPDGGVRLTQARGLLVPNASGAMTRVIGTSLDITERRAAVEALRASEASYRTIFEHASDAMWVHDLETGDFLAVNQAAVEMYGFSAEEQLAMGVAGLSLGEAPYRLEDAMPFVAAAAAGIPQRFEWLGRHKNGTLVWGEVRLRRVTLNGVDRILATARDINDRVRAEIALRQANEVLEQRVAERTAQLEQAVAEHAAARAELAESEEHFRRLIENSQDYIMLVDTEAAITSVSSSVERMLGWTPAELLGGRPADLLHPDDVGYVLGVFASLLERPGTTVKTRYRIRHKNGTWRLIESVGSTISPDSAADGVAANCRDITDFVEVEQALRERDERFRQIIESAADLVFMCDATGAMTYVAPSSLQLLGYAPDELMGARPFDLLHPEDVDATMRDLSWLLEHPGDAITSTFRIRRKDGVYIVMENVGRTLSTTNVQEGIIAFGRDITGRRAAEEALARAKEEAERANRAKSEFLSRMSHELRTPMNSILGFAQLLARGELAAQQSKSVQHILKAGRHLLHLINEVLEISRIEAGREQFSLEPVALAPVLEEVLGLVRPLAQQHGVTLHGGPWPGEAYVHADRQRLVQVLLNLLSNAIKYNHANGTVRLQAALQADRRCAIRVIDTGMGVPAHRLDELFTPFSRLGAEQSDVEGTGLGLALSRRLCEAMGGTLTLDSTTPDGSVFLVRLDAAESPLRVFESGAHFPAVRATYRDTALLYIEDNLANLSLVETILLARPGWRVLPALQGQLGVELAREHRPELILLDLHLPDIPGDEVLRRLRADPRTATTPIVIVSADATPTSVERLRVMGANAYLTKPLDVDEFLRVVDRFVPAPGAPL